MPGEFVNMTYPLLKLNGDLHPCYPAGRTFAHCISSTLFPKLECAKEKDDFIECNTKARFTAASELLAYEIQTGNVVYVPVYDAKTDKFIYKRGEGIPKFTDIEA